MLRLPPGSLFASVSVSAAALVCGVLGVAPTSRADDAAPHALLAVTSADPMDYAAVTRRIGDTALASALSDEDATAELQLAALRASPYARAPELLLGHVVTLAEGTDPALAPGALRAAAQIAERIDFDALEQRESDPALLEPPAERLTALGEDSDARADLRQLALDVAARLRSVQQAPQE